MKLLRFIICSTLLLFTINSYAQRYDDIKTTSLSAGWIKEGFNVSLDYEIIRTNNALILELNYFYRDVELKKVTSGKVRVDNYVGGIKYRRYFPKKSLYPYLSAGIIGGYENQSIKKIPDSVLITRKDGFFWAFSYDVGIEYALTHSSIYLAYKPFYDFTHKEYVNSINIGYKFYF